MYMEEILEDLSGDQDDIWKLIDNEVNDEVEDEVEDEELDCPEKKKTMGKWHQAIPRRLALACLWTAIYNLIPHPNTPQEHIKIDDEERQLPS